MGKLRKHCADSPHRPLARGKSLDGRTAINRADLLCSATRKENSMNVRLTTWIVASFALCLAATSKLQAQVQQIQIYNTGVDNLGSILSSGVDLHYSLVG